MNEFKKKLRTVKQDKKEILEKDFTKQVDEEISANIAKALFEMQNSSEDSDKRRQILDRMLNINNLFRKGFDQEIKKLKEIEKNERWK